VGSLALLTYRLKGHKEERGDEERGAVNHRRRVTFGASGGLKVGHGRKIVRDGRSGTGFECDLVKAPGVTTLNFAQGFH